MPSMPHATGPQENEEGEFQDALRKLMESENAESELNAMFQQPGEKAEDAVDYESDDSLADEEDAKPLISAPPHETAGTGSPEGLVSFTDPDLPGLTNDEHDADDIDALFGGDPSSPVDFQFAQDGEPGPAVKDEDHSFDDLFGDSAGDSLGVDVQPAETSGLGKASVYKSIELSPQEPIMSKEEQLQRELFAMSSKSAFAGSDYPPAPPQNQEELLASLWPKFERNAVPKFMDLLPPKVAHWRGQRPVKPPKPVQPTKVSLELAIDQEKLFRSLNPSYKRVYDEMDQQVISIAPFTTASDDDDDEAMQIDSDYENEPVGGVSWRDLQVLCQDWNLYPEPFPEVNLCADCMQPHATLSELNLCPDCTKARTSKTSVEEELFREVDIREAKVSLVKQL